MDRLEGVLSTADFETYLLGGRWSETADDNIEGEAVPSEAVEKIVRVYNQYPEDAEAVGGLGLLALTLGIAEWGVTGTNLPNDPAGKHWRSDTGEDSGKHLMSYAVGGVGISHADVGDLEEFVRWLAGTQIVLEDRKAALIRLAEVRYKKSGIVYDEVRAVGRCGRPAENDLLGERFQHFQGPAGSVYCRDYKNDQLTEEDWQVFRTWIRKALRTREAQAYLLELWFRDYWRPTTEQAPTGEGFAEECLVNVRVRNSAPRVATDAFGRNPPLSGVAGRVQRQIDAYADWKLRTARRRWKIMMRPVVLYRHFSGLSELAGINCR
jgi:hypothetical protein